MGSLIKIIALCLLPIVACQYKVNVQQPQQQQQAQQENAPEQHEYLDIQTPEAFSFTASPLQKPESLQSRPYFDFLSTLYAHDAGKKSLFSQPPRDRRQARSVAVPETLRSELEQSRKKRAIVFRPLFVYRQQEIRKQKIQSQNDLRRY